MGKEYYIIQSNAQTGPFTLSEIRKFNLSQDTLVWTEGFDDWTKAGAIEEFELFFSKQVPPPIQDHEKITPQPISKSNLSKKNIILKDGILKNNTIVLIISLGILCIVLIVFITNRRGDNNEYALKTEHIQEDPVKHNEVTESPSQIEPTVSTNTPSESPKKRQLSEDEIRDNLYWKEQARPDKYLDASGTYKVNLAANTIITGEIKNNATVTIFSNVKLVARFYSKTDYLLGEKSFVVLENLDPYENIEFTHKISGWWSDIDHWTLDVVTSDAEQHYGFE